MASYVAASIVAENTFTDWIAPRQQDAFGISPIGLLEYSVSGTFVATMSIQKRYKHGNHPDDVTYTDAVTVKTFANTDDADVLTGLLQSSSTNVQFRLGCETSNFTSGTAVCRLEQ